MGSWFSSESNTPLINKLNLRPLRQQVLTARTVKNAANALPKLLGQQQMGTMPKPPYPPYTGGRRTRKNKKTK